MLAAVFAVAFGLSLLRARKPLCLRFAERVSGGILPEGADVYCRRLTWVWFAILTALTVLNFALIFALSPGDVDPTHHTVLSFCVSGAVSAVVVALTFAVEKYVRKRRFRVVFHTSGSTGDSKTVVKTFESLAKEVVVHRAWFMRRFGASVRNTSKLTFLGTVQWDHMYGKLWMEMLPKALCAKADPDVIRTPEELIAKMNGAEKVVLVTTPAFLDRFAEYAGQYEIPGNVVEVVSSGALLTKEVSDAAERVFGVAPRQIFGSTETGGVAERRFPDESFHVFPGIRVALRDGRMEVRSPYSFRSPYLMGDGAELAPDGRSFRLLGRLDRLAKINEERVNLAEMEEKVRSRRSRAGTETSSGASSSAAGASRRWSSGSSCCRFSRRGPSPSASATRRICRGTRRARWSRRRSQGRSSARRFRCTSPAMSISSGGTSPTSPSCPASPSSASPWTARRSRSR